MTTYIHIPIVDDWNSNINLPTKEKQGFTGRTLSDVFFSSCMFMLAKQLSNSDDKVYPQWNHLWAYNDTDDLNIAQYLFDFPAVNEETNPVLENLWYKTYEDSYKHVCQLKSRFPTGQRELTDNSDFKQWCAIKFEIYATHAEREMPEFIKGINFYSHIINKNNIIDELRSAQQNNGMTIKQSITDSVTTLKPSDRYIGIYLSAGASLEHAAYAMSTDIQTAKELVHQKYMTILKEIKDDITYVYITSEDKTYMLEFIDLCENDETLKDITFLYKNDLERRQDDYIEKTYSESETINYYQKLLEDSIIVGLGEKVILGYSMHSLLIAILSNLTPTNMYTLDEIGSNLFSKIYDGAPGDWTLELLDADVRTLGNSVIATTYATKQPY